MLWVSISILNRDISAVEDALLNNLLNICVSNWSFYKLILAEVPTTIPYSDFEVKGYNNYVFKHLLHSCMSPDLDLEPFFFK